MRRPRRTVLPFVLPHGPHTLGRAAVAASQRARLTTAVTAAVAAHGYAGTTIRAIAQHAGVSYATFYEHFVDKEACFFAAYDEVVDELLAAMAAAVTGAPTPHDALRLGIEAYFGWFARHAAAAITFLIEIRSAGARALERRARILARFETFIWMLVEQARVEDPTLPRLERVAVTALVVTIDALASDEVRRGRGRHLTELCSKAMYVAVVLLAGHDTAMALDRDDPPAAQVKRTP